MTFHAVRSLPALADMPPPDRETETVDQNSGLRGFIVRAYRPTLTSVQNSRGTGDPVGPARCWRSLIAAGLLLAC